MARLDAQARSQLLDIARSSIVRRLRGASAEPDRVPADPALDQPAGAFVTLKKDEMLRGCIGSFEAARPLRDTVAEMACSAAFRDPRFGPLAEDELADITVEISVLSPLRRIDDVGEIEVGRHGIYLKKGYQRGVLLPQVATEYGWDRIAFLEHTCRKAGLHVNAWREGAEILVFEAEIFGEADCTADRRP